jgi:hypothetical protein
MNRFFMKEMRIKMNALRTTTAITNNSRSADRRKRSYWRRRTFLRSVLKNENENVESLELMTTTNENDNKNKNYCFEVDYDYDIEKLKPTTMMMMSNKKKGENRDHRQDEVFQVMSVSAPNNNRGGVLDVTRILTVIVGCNIFFLVSLSLWVTRLKRRYDDCVWKMKGLETEKRDLQLRFNLEKADLVDPLNSSRSRRVIGGLGELASSSSQQVSGARSNIMNSNDFLLQGLKAERDALKQALNQSRGELQRYAKENVILERDLELALLQVEKLTPID